MRGKLSLLLLLLVTTISASGFDFSPSEVSSVRTYSYKPLFTVPTPVIHSNTIYAAGGQGDALLAISLRGELLWSQRVGGFIATPPLLIPDVALGPTLRGAWVVVLTESQELRAYDAKTGALRLYGLSVPSLPARVPLQYAGDGRTVILPLQSSVQAVDIRTKGEIFFKNLTFRVASVKYIDGKLLGVGESEVALLDMKGNLRWGRSFGIGIEAFGVDSKYLALLLKNNTLISLDMESGSHLSKLDLSDSLGYTVPKGEFPLVGGIATLTGSKGVILQVDLRGMVLRRTVKAFIEPVKQPMIVENALFYFGRGGLVRVYHLPSGIRLFDLKLGAELGSDAALQKDPANRSYYLTVFDNSGSLRILRFPELWIKLLDVREEGGGYLIEGYVCSTAAMGSPASVSIYTLDSEAKPLGEKRIGSISPGQCGSRFSTFLPSSGAIGLVSGDFRFPPNLVIGMSPEEWISIRPGAVTTTTKPEVVPSLSYEAPKELKVGEELVVRLRGVNGWKATNLTLLLTGEGVEERVVRLEAGYGEAFDLRLSSIAKRESEDVRLILIGDGEILLEEFLPLRIERGRLIESLQAPPRVEVNGSLEVNLTLVNRYEDGQRFRVIISLGDLREERVTVPLAAGASQKLNFSLRLSASGSLQLVASVLSQDGTKLEEQSAPVLVVQPEARPPTTQPPVTPTQAVTLPIPLEYLVSAAVALVAVISAALLLRPRKPKKRVEVVVPEVVPPLEVPEEAPLEYPLEEIPFEWEEVKPTVPEVIEKPEAPVELERPIVPELKPPAEEVELLENELKALNTRLEDLKRRLESVEDLLGFEVSPYRMVDAEASLVSAELRLREGKLEEAEKLIRSTRESLNVLAEEVKEAERVFRENWGAVENRVEIMLRVWGKAPATMLTMVPPSFRIAALERYMRMHKEKRLELRGDELISLSG